MNGLECRSRQAYRRRVGGSVTRILPKKAFYTILFSLVKENSVKGIFWLVRSFSCLFVCSYLTSKEQPLCDVHMFVCSVVRMLLACWCVRILYFRLFVRSHEVGMDCEAWHIH